MSLFKHKNSSEGAVMAPDAPTAAESAAESSGEATTSEVESTEAVESSSQTAPIEQPAAATPMRFDRLFDEWMLFPFAGWANETVTVERSDTDGALVVRASLPGLDPVKDVELTVSDGVLWIDGAHREEQRTEDEGRVRHEVRYGSFTRSILLPEGVKAKDIEATANAGVLEIRIPAPAQIDDVEKVAITSR
jgi:HSP20 family protein